MIHAITGFFERGEKIPDHADRDIRGVADHEEIEADVVSAVKVPHHLERRKAQPVFHVADGLGSACQGFSDFLLRQADRQTSRLQTDRARDGVHFAAARQFIYAVHVHVWLIASVHNLWLQKAWTCAYPLKMDNDGDDEANRAKLLADLIGRRKLAEELGVRTTAVSNAVVAGAFPARWFAVIERLCAEVGEPCPREAFTFLGREDAA